MINTTAFAPLPVLRRVDGSTISTTCLDTMIPGMMKQAGVIGLDIAVINRA
jgi:hypothetical protein